MLLAMSHTRSSCMDAFTEGTASTAAAMGSAVQVPPASWQQLTCAGYSGCVVVKLGVQWRLPGQRDQQVEDHAEDCHWDGASWNCHAAAGGQPMSVGRSAQMARWYNEAVKANFRHWRLAQELHCATAIMAYCMQPAAHTVGQNMMKLTGA